MKSHETTLRLKRFEADAKARKIADIDMMINDLTRMASDLEQQILSEEERSGIKDPSHYAYSTFAKAAAKRLKNVNSSIDDLKAKHEQAVRDYEEAREELQKTEAVNMRDANRNRGGNHPKPAVTVAPAPSEH